MAEEVELHNAYMWDCPECGRENFVRAVRLEMNQEDSKKFAEDLGLLDHEQMSNDDLGVGIVRVPNNVKCRACGRSFDTIDPL